MPKDKTLSPMENRVMKIVWAQGSVTADDVRQALAAEGDREYKDSTVRTVLRRIEAKGYLTHREEGRSYVYHPTVPRRQAATQAVRRIVDRLCGGSVEMLLAGMVDDRMIDGAALRELATSLDNAAGRTNEPGDSHV